MSGRGEAFRKSVGEWAAWLWCPLTKFWWIVAGQRSYEIRSIAFMASLLTLYYCMGAIAQGGPDTSFYKWMAGATLGMMLIIAFGANYFQAKFGSHTIGAGHNRESDPVEKD